MYIVIDTRHCAVVGRAWPSRVKAERFAAVLSRVHGRPFTVGAK